MTAPTPTEGAPIDSGGPTTSEPVVISHAVTTILYAVAGAGWLTIPDPTINTIGTIAALVISTVGTFAARAKVSPTGRITWATIQDSLQAMLYDEIDRLMSLAPAGTPAAAGAAVVEAVTATQAIPPAAPAVTSIAPEGAPVGTFATSAPFGPSVAAAPVDSPTEIQPVITAAAPAAPPAQ